MVRAALLVSLATLLGSGGLPAQTPIDVSLSVDFQSSEGLAFSPSDEAAVRATLLDAARAVKALLPALSPDIRVTVVAIDRDLSSVGGVAGRADAPGQVLIEMSAAYPGGIAAAARDGLRAAFFHELHHLVRGWTIRDNAFGPGIPNAVVNEGLASVFAETYTGTSFERFDYPPEVGDWLQEILTLPVDANYNMWMNEHPDGRLAMGYRVGRYVVHEAMRRSGKSILELSEDSPAEILELLADQ